jgi:hypothetical protein
MTHRRLFTLAQWRRTIGYCESRGRGSIDDYLETKRQTHLAERWISSKSSVTACVPARKTVLTQLFVMVECCECWHRG